MKFRLVVAPALSLLLFGCVTLTDLPPARLTSPKSPAETYAFLKERAEEEWAHGMTWTEDVHKVSAEYFPTIDEYRIGVARWALDLGQFPPFVTVSIRPAPLGRGSEVTIEQHVEGKHDASEQFEDLQRWLAEL